MSDKDSSNGVPIRKRLAPSHTPEVSSESSESSESSGEEPEDLPTPVVDHYNARQNQIQGIDETDIKVLYNHFPPYLIEQTIGSGAYGSVHRGQQFNDQNRLEVAVKILKNGIGNANEYAMTLEREIIELLRPLPHENVVIFEELFSTLELNGDIRALYIISELSSVGDLLHTVQTVNPQGVSVWVPIKEGLARHLIKGIASGVRHLKSLDICHGDLKLANILLFDRPAMFPINDELDRTRIDRWTPKLTDFGNSKSREEDDPPDKIFMDFPLCTLTYASPESWSRNPDGSYNRFDAYSADVYSVGVCLLSLLIGANPFKAQFMPYPQSNDPEFERKLRTYIIYSNKIKSNESYVKHLCKIFSHPLRQLLLKSLNPNPEQRITIEQFLTDPCITTHKSTESENVSRPVSGYYGIFPTLKAWTGKDFPKES